MSRRPGRPVPRVVRAGVALTVGAVVARRATHRWGATLLEHRTALPGDEHVPEPATVATRAVTIDASPEEIWPWLVQIGQGRGGMYSYDWLENIVGLDIHSTDEIRDEWQDLAVGDRVVLMRPGYAGVKAGYTLPVDRVEPPNLLVLRMCPPEHPWDSVWSFHVEPIGPDQSRLISRSRTSRHRGAKGVLDLVMDAIMDPVTFVMTRKMLLGIKERSERAA